MPQKAIARGGGVCQSRDKTEPIYADLAVPAAKSAYAVGNWFNPPEVREIDVRGYTGQAGETVRAKVTDDVKVTQVKIVISTGDDGVAGTMV